MNYKYLIHHGIDNAGVAVQYLKSNEKIAGIVMEKNKEVTITPICDIAFGHKIALVNIKSGAPIIKYGEKIGNATKDINKGEWIHTQNLKSARW